MNPAAARKGNSFAGVVGYITHDVGKASTERVAFVQTLNLLTDDPAKAAKVMAWTALHAGELKEAAGIQATGRKGENPVYHFSLNWEPGETIAHNEMVAAAGSVLKTLGYDEHEVVLAAHTDKAHHHVHIVVNRVHPVTGKTHNPNNDYDKLQRWAYQYEKDRGRVVCLDRAIKYEKDKALKAEYQRLRDAELAAGQTRESKPRPQWEAERDATHPKSALYQQIKAQFSDRVRNLNKAGRAAGKRRADAWKALASRQAAEREALQAPSSLKVEFKRVTGPDGVQASPGATLKKTHAEQMRELRARIKEENGPDIARFTGRQKAAWRDFFAMVKAEGAPALKKALQGAVDAVAKTPVSQQGPEHRNHLAALFTAQAHDPAGRKAAFAKVMDAEKSAFFADLARRNAPAFDRLKTQQQQEVQALPLAGDPRKEKTALLSRHREERAALRAEHHTDIEVQRKAWATLNADRAQAWADYKVHRAAQAQVPAGGQGGPAADRSHLFEGFKPRGLAQGGAGGPDPARSGPKRDR
jgi:hypothetical protein